MVLTHVHIDCILWYLTRLFVLLISLVFSTMSFSFAALRYQKILQHCIRQSLMPPHPRELLVCCYISLYGGLFWLSARVGSCFLSATHVPWDSQGWPEKKEASLLSSNWSHSPDARLTGQSCLKQAIKHWIQRLDNAGNNKDMLKALIGYTIMLLPQVHIGKQQPSWFLHMFILIAFFGTLPDCLYYWFLLYFLLCHFHLLPWGIGTGWSTTASKSSSSLFDLFLCLSIPLIGLWGS